MNQPNRASHYVALAEQARREMFGPKRQAWLDRLTQEYAAIQAALRWCAEQGEAEQGLQLAIGLREFWIGGSQLDEGRQWLETFLAQPQLAAPSKLRAQGIDDLASLAHWQDDRETAYNRNLEALALRRAINDKPGLVISLIHAGNTERLDKRNLAAARAYYEECQTLVDELYGDRGLPVLKSVMGNLALDEGDYLTAERLLRQALIAQRAEEALWTINFALDSFACLAAQQGYPAKALRLAAASEELRTASGILLSAVWQTWIEGLLRPAWQAFDQATADQLWAEGRSLTWQQAVAYALERPAAEPI